ncbi:hypothetical protein B0H19DRAFT_1236908 [Mycena capillaripes]|nr:hypothetical protein B0H19DRAFT_1236908 [Mycena capillaripes]
MYTMRPSAISGIGAFASRDIKIGEDIIAERPFLMFPAETPRSIPAEDYQKMAQFIYFAVGNVIREYLPLPERPEFFDLLDRSSQSAVFQRNTSWVTDPLPGGYEGGYGVICRNISRINHSCEPNVIQRWDPGSLILSVRALSHIHKGEELLRYYLDPTIAPRPKRIERLADIYDFECSCPSCSLPPDKSLQSDLNRYLLHKELEKRWASSWDFESEYSAWLNDQSLPDDHIVKHSTEIIRLMDQERVGETRLRMFHYTRLMRAYSALGDKENTRRWARRIVPIMEPGLSELRQWAVRWAVDPEIYEERRVGPNAGEVDSGS